MAKKEYKFPDEIIEDAFASVPFGIIITDNLRDDNPLIYVNRGFEKLTGYSKQEILGKNCRFLQGKEINQESLKLIRQSIKEGIQCTAVLRNYRKDGSMFFNELTISPIHDSGDNVTHFIGFQKDVSDQIEALKKAEELKLESQNRFNALSENSSQQIWRIDFIPPISLNSPIQTQVKQVFERGVYAEANDLLALAYGYEKGSEIIGKYMKEFYNDTTPENIKTIENLAKVKYYVKDIITIEKNKDGENIIFLNNTKPEIEKNKVKHLWGTAKDVTDLYRLNNKVSELNVILKKQKGELVKKNIALTEIIHQIEDDKKYLEMKIKGNIESLILPYFDKLKILTKDKDYLSLLRESILNLTSEFGIKINHGKENLTRREIEISDLVRNGLSNKEISNLLNIALHTVEKHRRTIRKKLNLVKKKINLYTYFNSD